MLLEPEREYTMHYCCLNRKSLSLQSWEHVPDWQKDNKFICSGYRTNMTILDSFWSIFAIHNETGNIWTHLLAAILFVGIGIYDQIYTLTNSALADRILFAAFCTCASICYFTSAIFHTFLGTNEKIVILFARLDYTGIILFIYSAFATIVYYNFCNHYAWLIIYMVLFSILFVCILTIINRKEFEKKQYRVLRSVLFTSFGLLMLVPLIHRAVFYTIISYKAYFFLLGELISVLIAAYVFAKQIPERYFAGKFDLIMHSHQILHVLVVIAALCHYMAIATWMQIKNKLY
jgi:adiponectin receptor